MHCKTNSGKHVIFDITDSSFIAGNIPTYFADEAAKNGVWFFQPADWFPNSDWYGSIINTQFTKFPMLYSSGFNSPEDALSAAEKWEEEEAAREWLKPKNLY